MLKPLKYRFRDESVFVSNCSEARFHIMKMYSTHWVNQGLGFGDYLAYCGNTWDVHPINASSEENCYTVLSESDRGPMVIALNNAVCTQFHVNAKYPSSMLILRNFVNHYMSIMHSARERLDIPIRKARFLPASHMLIKGTRNPRSPAEAGQHSVAYTVAKHSGFAFSKRDGPVLVGNNATTYMIVKANSTSLDSSTELSKTINKSASLSHIAKTKRNSSYLKAERPEECKVSPHYVTSSLWPAPSIRAFLHPGYPVESMPKPPNSSLHLSQMYEKKPTVRVVYQHRLAHSKTESWSSSAHIRKRTDINTSEIIPKLETQRSTWMSRKDFQRVFPKTSKLDLKVELDTTAASARPQFREEERGKWLAGPFFSTVA